MPQTLVTLINTSFSLWQPILIPFLEAWEGLTTISVSFYSNRSMSLTNASSNNVIASFRHSLAPLGAIASYYTEGVFFAGFSWEKIRPSFQLKFDTSTAQKIRLAPGIKRRFLAENFSWRRWGLSDLMSVRGNVSFCFQFGLLQRRCVRVLASAITDILLISEHVLCYFRLGHNTEEDRTY